MSLGITLHEGFQFSLSQTGGEPTVVPTIPFPEQRNELNNPAVGAPGHNPEGGSQIIDISVFREKSAQERKIAEHEKACKYTNEMLSELHQLITTSLSN